jgi:hypothetical protein
MVDALPHVSVKNKNPAVPKSSPITIWETSCSLKSAWPWLLFGPSSLCLFFGCFFFYVGHNF